ncbi:sugar transferase [Streptococcus sp. zg-JUN1979]|uniref:sugar transferase n=1 Tax=Streptococcus sp. zg-JUN1979 TaxID=3391450 RepID=UPI0039A5F03F
MRVYLTNINGMAGAAQIGQNMVTDLAVSMGYRELGIYAYNMHADSEGELNKRLDGILASLRQGDVVILQLPTWNSTAFDERLLHRIKLFGVKVVIFIHDVVPLMFASNFYLMDRVIAMYNQADVLIAPSQAMIDRLKELGLETSKVVLQRLWDNPTPLPMQEARFKACLHFPGNPDRFPFMRDWQYDVPLYSYGHYADLPDTVVQNPWQSNDELIRSLSAGGFGLVWMAEHDKAYMKLYCPYKLGTFLAAGIPVIVERGIANQDLIEQNGLGLVVDSLEEAVGRIKAMSEETYQTLVANVRAFNPLVREGYFTRRLLTEAIFKVYDNS